ncbi:MAG: TonB-dependent receptor [Steroidobacteraceae bacterium]
MPNQINFNEDRKKEALKLALRYEPLDNVTVDYGYDSSEMNFGNHFYQVVAGPTAVPGRQEKANRVRGLHPSDTEVSGHNLTLAWDLDSATVRSISAYRELDSQTNMNFVDIFTQDNMQAQHQVSQELQLVGDALGDRIKYATGLFFFEENSRESLASLFGGGARVDQWHVKSQSSSAAVYGQATWTPPVLEDRLGVTLGLRYTEDSRKATKTYVRTDLSPAVPVGLVVVGDRDFDSLNPAVTLDYGFTTDIRGYAKYSTGYRAGGFSTQSTPDLLQRGLRPRGRRRLGGRRQVGSARQAPAREPRRLPQQVHGSAGRPGPHPAGLRRRAERRQRDDQGRGTRKCGGAGPRPDGQSLLLLARWGVRLLRRQRRGVRR